jgi:hypothetical protein
MRRGLQAAVSAMTAPRHPQTTMDLNEIGIWLPNDNVTQNQPRRDPVAVTRLTT